MNSKVWYGLEVVDLKVIRESYLDGRFTYNQAMCYLEYAYRESKKAYNDIGECGE